MINNDVNKKTEEQIKDLKLINDNKKKDFKKLLKQPEFRRFIWSLLNNECKLYTVWTAKEIEAIHLLEGMRFVGLAIRDKILECDPIFLERMASEEASIKNSKDKIKKI